MPRACMAASFTILTGRPNAFLKSNPTHPPPRLCGSRKGWPWITGPGYPMETTEYSQPAAAFRTSLTIFRAVIFDPDGILTGSFRPVTSTFTFVPPTSITNTYLPCLFIRFRAGHKDITGHQTSHGGDLPVGNAAPACQTSIGFAYLCYGKYVLETQMHFDYREPGRGNLCPQKTKN